MRIVSGRFRGKALAAPPGQNTRPTGDRARQAVFNILEHAPWSPGLHEARVIDLFAGSGALGFEAASRGVAQAVLVESDRRATASLEALRARLGADNVSIVTGDARAYLARPAARFDLVLLDPPFGQDWLDRILASSLQALTGGGMLYIEAEAPIQAPPGTELLRQDKAGAVHFHLLRAQAKAA